MQSVQLSLPLGSIIHQRYLVESLLGKGGFGAVYLVRDLRVKGNVFALKEVADLSQQGRKSLIFEGDVLKRVDHPALPRVYRTFEDDTRVYLLMDYIEGPNLELLRKMQPEKRFSVAQAMKIMAPIVDAVAYLHALHPPIIHRDIKPSNIIVPTSDAGAVLVDFGIAKEYDQDSTTTAVRHGSPGYCAPEHYSRGTGPRSDIYSLGATFYTLLTGVVPIDSLYRLTQLSSKNADPLEPVKAVAPSVPEPIAEAVQRALVLNSNERFATVEEFWQALSSYNIAEAAEAPLVLPGLLSAQQGFVSGATPRTPAVEVFPTMVRPNATMSAISRDRKNRGLFPVFIALALVAIVAGAAFGASHLPAKTGHSQPTPIHQPTTVPTAKPTIVATTVPNHYPILISSYNGNISDVLTKPPTNSTMSLARISQSGATISGYFAVGAGLSGNGNFTGSVTTDNKIQFTVPGVHGFLPLFFQGQIQPDGSVTGTYCSYRNASCDYAAGGYGYWSVLPVVPNAPSSSITIPGSSWQGNDDDGNGRGNDDGHGKKKT
ncbi:MAG TPA: serine/threonine-protein kinase [Ktedonobacteraceae bacterium]|nr:serine/threonine-protein kinase [Ktedonobacteraceae bacterium]